MCCSNSGIFQSFGILLRKITKNIRKIKVYNLLATDSQNTVLYTPLIDRLASLLLAWEVSKSSFTMGIHPWTLYVFVHIQNWAMYLFKITYKYVHLYIVHTLYVRMYMYVILCIICICMYLYVAMYMSMKNTYIFIQYVHIHTCI